MVHEATVRVKGTRPDAIASYEMITLTIGPRTN